MGWFICGGVDVVSVRMRAKIVQRRRSKRSRRVSEGTAAKLRWILAQSRCWVGDESLEVQHKPVVHGAKRHK
jgi:hypothetical protein